MRKFFGIVSIVFLCLLSGGCHDEWVGWGYTPNPVPSTVSPAWQVQASQRNLSYGSLPHFQLYGESLEGTDPNLTLPTSMSPGDIFYNIGKNLERENEEKYGKKKEK